MPKKPTKKKVSKKNSKALKLIKSVKGMHDILPDEQFLWNRIKRDAREILEFYNFGRIDTPVVEQMNLFERSSGETSDIVQKEMFTLKAKAGGYNLALRPEPTAGIVRSYIENGMSKRSHPVKVWTTGPMFRKQKPQAGRFRQFHQIGCEVFSVENDPVYDAQVILATYRILEKIKIKNLVIHINTIGCRSCKGAYRKSLVSYYRPKIKNMCKDCKIRINKNPLRLLDCKSEKCQDLKKDAPITLDNICKECKAHFKGLLEYLEDLGLPYMLDNYLVRGLDYYTKTVFEIFTENEEGENLNFALAGGGRYDYLVGALGGKATPAVGMGMGIESVLEVIKQREVNISPRPKDKVFLIHIGELAKRKSLSLIETLRENKINVAESLGKGSLGAQLRTADKANASFALIFGQKEAFEESIILRNMKTGAQETVLLKKIATIIKRKM